MIVILVYLHASAIHFHRIYLIVVAEFVDYAANLQTYCNSQGSKESVVRRSNYTDSDSCFQT